MIEISGISKSFKSKKETKLAVNNLSVTVEPGRIYGLLGPNGAGKTTTLRMIATLIKPDSGTIKVNGIDTIQDPRDVRKAIGFLTGDMKLTGNLSPRYLLKFFGELNQLSRERIAARTEELATYLDMAAFLDKPIEKCSTGMRQKTSIAVSLIHDPSVILFDEPTSGLDVFAAKTVVDFLRDYKRMGKTVILSTHIMSEAERLCDKIGILLDGELKAEGSVDELRKQHGLASLEEVFFKLAAKQMEAANV